MKNKLKTLMLLFTISTGDFLAAQNLVPNPSFEIHDTCPESVSELSHSSFWFQPSKGTPDYFDSCSVYPVINVPQNFFGVQNAHSGNAYAGLFTFIYWDSIFANYREYCEIKLSSPLLADSTYYVTFFISLADSMNYATDDFGVLFSNDSVLNDTGYYLPFLPQVINTSGNFLIDKINWIKVSGSYIANGGEQYITIGNFMDSNNTDTIAVSGGSTNIGQSDYLGGYYYLDDVCVSTDSIYASNWTGLNYIAPNSKCQIFPNPGNSYINLTNFSVGEYFLFNFLGSVIREGKIINDSTIMDVSNIPSGLYLLKDSNLIIHKITIYH